MKPNQRKAIYVEGVLVTGNPTATIRLTIETDIDLSDALAHGIEDTLDQMRQIGSAVLKTAKFVEDRP